MECLACGTTDARASREHVFAQWLLTELYALNLAVGLFRNLGDGTSGRVREDIRLDSFKLKKVCERCNNGWMSELETLAKPLILELIREGIRPDALCEESRQILAKWAAKTAIIESHAVGAESPVSGEYLKFMRKRTDNVPGRLAVAACNHPMTGIGHMQVGVIRDLIGGGIAAGNIVMIVLPRVAFTCLFPMIPTTYEARLVPSLYTPLWPTPAAWRPMRQDPMPGAFRDDTDRMAAMAERVELFHYVK